VRLVYRLCGTALLGPAAEQLARATQDIEKQVLLAENAGHYTLGETNDRLAPMSIGDKAARQRTETQTTDAAAETAVKRTEKRSDARTFQPSQTNGSSYPAPAENRM